MRTRSTLPAAALSALALVAACGSAPTTSHQTVGNAYSTPPQAATQYGYVTQIDTVSIASRPSGGGAVLGAVIGAVLGHQIGSGTGQDVATGVGAVGGAVVGHQIERRSRRDDEVFRITVRLQDGRVEQFDYQDIGNLRTGDRVKIEGGQVYRL